MTTVLARSIRPATAALLAAVVCAAFGAMAAAADQSMATTRFQVTFRTITSLRLSDHVLVITPRAANDEGPVSAGAIDFRAAARTSGDGEVLLTVEPLAPIQSLSGGASEGATTVGFEGSGDGAQSGLLSDAGPEIAARWVGGGLREGRLSFTVRGPVAPRGGVLPLRFLLTAP
jgi:hypothetical protein